jgi:hypothetical protein
MHISLALNFKIDTNKHHKNKNNSLGRNKKQATNSLYYTTKNFEELSSST